MLAKDLQTTILIVMPIAIALVLAAVIWTAQMAYNRLSKTRRLDYRARYRRLIYLFEQSTGIVNRLEADVPSVEKEKKLVDYYIATLGVLEALLRTVKSLSPHKGDSESLNTALYLAQDLNHRSVRVKEAFADFKSKKKVDYEKLLNQKKPGFLNVIGCYFCSRPYKADFFSHVRVKVGEAHMEVFACKVCEQELAQTKSVRILSFMQNGKSVHWSKVKGYKPSKEYWHLNLRRSDEVVRRRPSLLLMKSDKINSPDSPSPDALN